jgi:hypothetical protein
MMPDDVPKTTEPDANQWERIFDATEGKMPQAQVETPASAVVASPIEDVSAEDKKPEVPDEQLPALYYPDKYKNRAEEKKGIAENISRVHEANDVLSRQKKLMANLADPEKFSEAFEELIKVTGRSKEDIAKALNLSIDPTVDVDGDELIDRNTLNQSLQEVTQAAKEAAKGETKPLLEMLVKLLEPQLLAERNKELSEKYPLVTDPEVVKIRDKLNQMEVDGEITRDEMVHQAALFRALLDGKKTIDEVVDEQVKASHEATRDRMPDSGANSQGAPVVTKKDLTPEERTQAKFDAIFDAV